MAGVATFTIAVSRLARNWPASTTGRYQLTVGARIRPHATRSDPTSISESCGVLRQGMKKDGLCALLVFAVAFAGYAWSASPYPARWDTGEQQTVPYILGIGHPTGFPLFTLLGWVFTHVVPISSVAWRMNVFSGLCVALACAGVALIAIRLGAGRIEAVLGALIFAWCQETWSKGGHADPHALSLALVVFVLLFAVRYTQDGNPKDLIASALAAGLGLAAHPETILCVPAIFVAVALRGEIAVRAWAWAALALILPLAIYAYLPLRSAYVAAHGLDPLVASPVFGFADSVWDTNHTRTLSGFLRETSGSQFGAPSALLALFDVGSYFLASTLWVQRLQAQLPFLAIVLAGVGALGLLLRDARSLAVLLAGTICAVPFIYGFRFVEADIDRYLLPSFAVAAALAAACARLSIERFGPRLRSIAACALLVAAAAMQFASNRGALDARLDKSGQGVIDAVRRDVPDGAIVISSWTDGTALEYGAYVDRSLGTRTIVVGWASDYGSIVASWTAVKRVYIFADETGLANAVHFLPPGWFTNNISSDGAHHVLRITPVGP